MKIKLKSDHPGNRTSINVFGHYMKISKTWKEVTPKELEYLYINHNQTLDFFTPEIEVIKNLIKKEETKLTETKVEEVKEVENKFDIAKLKAMSKNDLEAFARANYGIELDKRKSLIDMIRTLKSAVESK